MRYAAYLIGRLIWWCAWPAMWLYLRDSERTRLVLQNGKGQVLVVKGWIASDGKWSLPGGGLHEGEDHIQGLLREVREEVGLTLQAEEVRPLMERRIKSKGFRSKLYFYAASVDTDPVLTLLWYEIAEAAWIDLEKLTATSAQPDVVQALELLAHPS
jgi:8-oxo-dGTP pyrophosphatase MutT (NUDIX family)